jgi:hypothetical protein
MASDQDVQPTMRLKQYTMPSPRSPNPYLMPTLPNALIESAIRRSWKSSTPSQSCAEPLKDGFKQGLWMDRNFSPQKKERHKVAHSRLLQCGKKGSRVRVQGGNPAQPPSGCLWRWLQRRSLTLPCVERRRILVGRWHVQWRSHSLIPNLLNILANRHHRWRFTSCLNPVVLHSSVLPMPMRVSSQRYADV